jgi:hypothetical protein
MEERAQVLECMDFSCGWSQWRDGLKEALAGKGGRYYWQDELVDSMAAGLDVFLADRVCPATPQEELIEEMWAAAAPEERRTLAMVFLKVANRK